MNGIQNFLVKDKDIDHQYVAMFRKKVKFSKSYFNFKRNLLLSWIETNLITKEAYFFKILFNIEIVGNLFSHSLRIAFLSCLIRVFRN